MSSEKTPAIVIRVIDFSETSAVVTFFTREHGKITALAKGCRRPKSPFESAIDLLTACRIVFLHKKNDTLDLLTEAKVERRFRGGQRSLEHLYAGYYLAELLAEATDRSDPHPELFDLTWEIWQELNNLGDIPRLLLRFEMMLLRLLGQLPELSQCVETGRPVPQTGRIPFGLLAGGVLSRECRAGHRQVIDISADSLAILRVFADPGDAWRQQEMPVRFSGEIRAVINRYLTHWIGRHSKLREFLGILGT